LQNHTFLHWPQRCTLPLFPHARHEVAAGAIVEVRGGLGLQPGPAAAGERGTTSASVRGATSASVRVGAPSAGRQLAPVWPCLAATT